MNQKNRALLAIPLLLAMLAMPSEADYGHATTAQDATTQAYSGLNTTLALTSTTMAASVPGVDEPGVGAYASVEWVMVTFANGQPVVVNPLAPLGAESSPGLPIIETVHRDPRDAEPLITQGTGLPGEDTSVEVGFTVYFDTTGHADVGDVVKLQVFDGVTDAGNRDAARAESELEESGIYVSLAPTNLIDVPAGGLLAELERELEPGREGIVTFSGVPKAAGGHYVLHLPDASYAISPFLSTEIVWEQDPELAMQASSGNCKSTQTQFSWDNYDVGWEGRLLDEWGPLGWGAWKYHWQYGCDAVTASGGVALQDNFDDGAFDTSKWIYGGGVKEHSNCGSTSGTRALYFYGTSGRQVTTQPLDVRGGGTISFSIRHGTGTGGGPCDKPEPEHGDDMALLYSADGSTLGPIAYYYAGNHGSWSTKTVSIPGNAQTSTAQFRWVQLNYYNGNELRDHWAIDDVVIQTNPSSASKSLKPSFGFSFSGLNELPSNGLYNTVFAGTMDGDRQTMCRYYSGQHGQTCWGHVAWIQGSQFIYREPPGSGIQHSQWFVDGLANNACSSTMSDEAKLAITIAAFKFPWLGFATLAPDQTCRVYAKETDYGGQPGMGADIAGVGSSGQETSVSGFIATKYNTKGELKGEMRGSVDYEVWMKACYTCSDARTSGTHWYTVYPRFNVV